MPVIDGKIHCPVSDCDFIVDPDDESSREEMEQHVRWLHVRTGEWGEYAAPAITELLMNGVIGQQEYAELLRDIIQREIDKVPPPNPWRLRALQWTNVSSIILFIIGFCVNLASAASARGGNSTLQAILHPILSVVLVGLMGCTYLATRLYLKR